MSFGLLYLKGLFVLGLLVLVNNKLAYVLHFDKLHDSVCEDNSWIDRKCWQRFLSNICKGLFFKTNFHVFTCEPFSQFLSERLLYTTIPWAYLERVPRGPPHNRKFFCSVYV